MAIVNDNIITRSTSGRVGHVVFKRYKDYTVMSKVPDMSNVVFSKKQKQNHLVMAGATAYGKSIIADPKRKAAYAKENGIKLSVVFHTAVKEYYDNLKKKK